MSGYRDLKIPIFYQEHTKESEKITVGAPYLVTDWLALSFLPKKVTTETFIVDRLENFAFSQLENLQPNISPDRWRSPHEDTLFVTALSKMFQFESVLIKSRAWNKWRKTKFHNSFWLSSCSHAWEEFGLIYNTNDWLLQWLFKSQ